VSAPAHRTAAHRRARDAAAAALTAPTITRCPFCHQPIYPWQEWDLDHRVPVAHGGAGGETRPSHARCNRRAGGGIRTRRRAAPSRDW
jgi:ribosomal protein L32